MALLAKELSEEAINSVLFGVELIMENISHLSVFHHLSQLTDRFYQPQVVNGIHSGIGTCIFNDKMVTGLQEWMDGSGSIGIGTLSCLGGPNIFCSSRWLLHVLS